MAHVEKNKPHLNPHDEDMLVDSFYSREPRERRPDLGFPSVRSVQETINGLDRLLELDDVPIEVVGRYKGLLNTQMEFAQARDTELAIREDQAEERRMSRRKFLKKAVVTGGTVLTLGGVGAGVNYTVSSFRERRENQRLEAAEKLEQTNTLGVEATAESETGWRMYHPEMDENVVYVDSGSALAIDHGDTLQGDEKTFFHNTDIQLRKHERRGGEIIPKVRIITQSYIDSKGTRRGETEEWVLRTPGNSSDPGVDSRVVIMEKQDQLQTLQIPLQISYLGHNTFKATIMEKQATS